MNKKLLIPLFSLVSSLSLSACNPFIFINISAGPNMDWLKDTNNTLFLALYNYYGQEGQHFTNRWLGMLDALNEYGIEVTGHEAQKDAREFRIDYTNSKLPSDAEIYMVNIKLGILAYNLLDH